MKKKVYAYLHTHWDREWYRDKEDFNIRLLDVIDNVLDELRENRAPFFYLDGQVSAVIDYLKFRKNKLQEILYFIKAQKLAIGPYFVSADSFLCTIPFMLKNLEIGIKYSKDFYQNDFIGYMADIFGISRAAFIALKLKNINKAIIWRGVNPSKINNNANFLKNEIKTLWLAQGYFNDFFHQKEINLDGIKNYLDKISKYSCLNEPILLPIGADHLEILKNAKEKIEYVNRNLKNYEIILSSPFEYFKNVKFEYNTKEDEFLDNSSTYVLSGVYSTRIYQKARFAILQNMLSRKIEPLNFYCSGKYLPNIDYAYETLIKNQAHDSICACSIDSVQRSVEYRFDKVENILKSLQRAIIFDFCQQNNIQGKTKDKIGLFNLTNNDNLKTIEFSAPYIVKNSQIIKKEKNFPDSLLASCSKIPVTEDITTIYTQIVEIDDNKKFEFNSAKIKKPIKKTFINKEKIENENICLQINSGKVYIKNKKTKESFELKLSDIKDDGDTYNCAVYGEYFYYPLSGSKIIEDGLIKSTLRIIYPQIKLDVSLCNNSQFLEFSAKINNKKKNHKIQLVLCLKDKIKNTIAQDAAGIIKRNVDSSYDIRKHMPAPYPIELKSNCFPMLNFVCCENVIALTKGLNEYEIYENELRICLLRSIGTISNPKNKVRAIPAGPDLKTPEAQCRGENNAEFALLFGDCQNAFYNLDIYYKNYVVVLGEYKNEVNLKLDKIPDENYFLGLSENKKIVLNLKENKLRLI